MTWLLLIILNLFNVVRFFFVMLWFFLHVIFFNDVFNLLGLGDAFGFCF
jgi:hypothetical protein